MAENKPFGEATDVLTPVTDNALALATMIEALRAQTEAVKHSTSKVDDLTSEVSLLRTEIAVMQEQNKTLEDMREEIKKLQGRCASLELHDAKHSGVGIGMEYLKEWFPVAAMLLFIAWQFFDRTAK